jgi:hypothetical protein
MYIHMKNILIFGLGSALDDCDRWDHYVKNDIQDDLGPEFIGANWYGVTVWDIACPNNQHNIFVGNSDNLEHLRKMSNIGSTNKNCSTMEDTKLYNNVYDVITFDHSTVKYLNWGSEHVSVLYSMLKPDGKVYIEDITPQAPKFMRINPVRNPLEKYAYWQYGKLVKSPTPPDRLIGLFDYFTERFNHSIHHDGHYPLALQQTEIKYSQKVIEACIRLNIGVPDEKRGRLLLNQKRDKYYIFTKVSCSNCVQFGVSSV